MNRRKFISGLMASGAAVAVVKLNTTSLAATPTSLPPHLLKRKVTQADRILAAKNAKKSRATLQKTAGFKALVPVPGGTPDYFGIYPNYANSPILQKFVDSLPGLTPAGINNLGAYLPLANPDTITFPGSDYYEIQLVEYNQKFHSGLNPTKLRGYQQTNFGTAAGVNSIAPDGNPRYLGPVILANRDRPVRIKFTNKLPTGSGGNLFIPTDTTLMGAGMGPDGVNSYKQNRATLHLHGGNTPWISDGTPHQWTVPAGESTSYAKGVSTQYVPDMWFNAAGNVVPAGTPGATNNPGPGSMTFFYTNQQSARLMFYHDHAYGITRLNVYAGEAAGYLLVDPDEATLPVPKTATKDRIPLIIQDKTFIDTKKLLINPNTTAQDPTWPFTVENTRNDLWFPHVYMPNQNPYDISGANAMGRWDYGPWFWPPFTGLAHGEVSNPYVGSPGEPPNIPGTPNISLVPEGFMDTPIVNGQAYPFLVVDPKAYRFQILNACNDRSLNLQLYKASSIIGSIALQNGGAGYVAPPNVTITGSTGKGATVSTTLADGAVNVISVGNAGSGYTAPVVSIGAPPAGGTQAVASAVLSGGGVASILIVDGGSGYTAAPPVSISDSNGGTGTGATANASIGDGVVATASLITVGSGYVGPLTVTADAAPLGGTTAIITATIYTNPTEVGMVPAIPGSWPKGWPTPDSRDGGFPDPTTVGPNFLQIGTEGGVLPAPVVISNRPVGFDYNRRSITVLNILETALFLGPAERADVVVDFTNYAGKTIILYNDSPAPVPAFDPRNDYYTNNPDSTDTGGAPSTAPGYGPNTRTIMQFRVNNSIIDSSTLPNYDLVTLKDSTKANSLPAVFAKSQEKIIVPNALYNAVYNPVVPFPADSYARISSNSLGVYSPGVTGVSVVSGGNGYTIPPLVSFTGGGGGVGATAVVNGMKAASVASFTITNSGAGYRSVPIVTVAAPPVGAGNSTATAKATLSIGVTAITITNSGKGYTSAPTITFTGGTPTTPAAATAIISGGVVSAILITNPGAGYRSVPTLTFTGGGTPTTKAVATATTSSYVATIALTTVTSGGAGYLMPPVVTLTGGTPTTPATVTSVLTPTQVTSIQVTNPGSGYLAVPGVVITSANGAGAGATGSAAVGNSILNTPVRPKAIQELFETEYGRMNAILGAEIPNTTGINQTTIPLYYIDPPNEIVSVSDVTQPLGSASDGTQIWKITHNGVDTHAIHFHLFNVQLINRVGWDGAIKPPDANELGWKETVRMNPLEDAIVALRPYNQTLPWAGGLPNSIHALNPADAIGSTAGFSGFDPVNNPITVTNQVINFGYEYVWHCHLLGHEENDMMRPILFSVPPAKPTILTAVPSLTSGKYIITLTWQNNAKNATNFIVQRAPYASNTWTTLATLPSTTLTYVDNTPVRKTLYKYQILAVNKLGYNLQASAYATLSVNSLPSDPALAQTI